MVAQQTSDEMNPSPTNQPTSNQPTSNQPTSNQPPTDFSEAEPLSADLSPVNQAPSQRQLKRHSSTSGRVVLTFLSLLAIACQASNSPVNPVPSPLATSTPVASPSPTAPATLNPYVDQQVGFRFTYPDDFVISPAQNAVNRGTPDNTADNSLQTLLELWQREKYQAIQAGKYEGGTELPPNVQVAVYRNDDRLDLQKWLERQSDRFTMPREFETRSIAGQNALVFRSTGLYEHQNVVLQNAAGTQIIVISLSEVGVAEVDRPNQRAFTQILSTFQVTP